MFKSPTCMITIRNLHLLLEKTKTYCNYSSVSLPKWRAPNRLVVTEIRLLCSFIIVAWAPTKWSSVKAISTPRNFKRWAEFFFVFLTLVLYESAQRTKNFAARTKFSLLENSPYRQDQLWVDLARSSLITRSRYVIFQFPFYNIN